LSVYIEYYEDVLSEQHHSDIILAVAGQRLKCIGFLFSIPDISAPMSVDIQKGAKH
jgi:hypothetical protein